MTIRKSLAISLLGAMGAFGRFPVMDQQAYAQASRRQIRNKRAHKGK